jgi:cell division control protein 6
MGVFDGMLKEGENLIKNEQALDFEFLPKILPFRENEQRFIANSIKHLFMGRTGKNIVLHGPPGIGKTAAARHVLNELEEETDDVYALYINCWKSNTTYKILVDICDQLGYKFVQNKKTSELYKIVAQIINKKAAAFIFDEIDKVEDFDFLYAILEEIYKKSICLITNFKDAFVAGLDSRIKSRLLPEMLEFKQYNAKETTEILRQRSKYAFVDGCFEEDALLKVAEKTFEIKDIRTGLFLMRESALIAESKSQKNIKEEDVILAIAKLDGYTSKSDEELDDDSQLVLNVVREHSGEKIGTLFEYYQKEGGKSSYKTFQRKIENLDKNSFISTKKKSGLGGNTTIVEKKLTDF